MNVTNIGFPFAAPTAPGGATDGAAGTGFAGLLGAAAGADGQGTLSFGVAGALPQPGSTLLAAQTNAPLLPPTLDSGTSKPGDKPQVAMAQLLATAAPAAAPAPVVAGGNPLADAVAKALAKTTSAAGDATGTTTAPAAGPAPAANGQAPATDAQAPTPPKPPIPSAAATANAPTKISSAAQPEGDVALPAEAPVALASEAPATPHAPPPAKAVAKPARGTGEDDGTALANAVLPLPDTTTAPLPQPVAVAQAVVTPTTPENPVAASTSRTAKAEGAAALPATTMLTTDADTKPGDVQQAVASRSDGGEAKSGNGENTGQQAFAQQLAAADTSRAGAAPAAGHGATFAPAAMQAPAAVPAQAAAAATAAEPVIHARPGELGRNLGVEIARKVDAGEDTLRVRLNPAELGRVEVTLAFDDKGRVQATMRAESQHTLALLRQDAPDLGRALDQAGIRNDAASFRFESRDGGSGSSAGGQSAFQQQSRGGSQQFRDDPESQPAAYRPIRSDGQVDLIA